MRFHTDRRYELPVPPEVIWGQISQVERYRHWWPWLRRFDGTDLVVGETWSCTVQPPLPYVVRFDVHLDEVTPTRLVRATITGDVEGDARIELVPSGAGTDARLVSHLGPGSAWLGAIARVVAPVARFGHDWVLDAGARQFIRSSGGSAGRDVA